ncbi:MAG: hypothetical protein ABSB22_23420 [Thermodesulfobacteriota bacterium]|jgi:hypothetical protein
MECNIILPGKWIDVLALDGALERSGGPHDSKFNETTIRFCSGSKVMVDAGARILSLANQLASTGSLVSLVFEDGQLGTMGYLNRMGFFDSLSPSIRTIPDRPLFSGATGTSINLVEFERISPNNRDETLPSRLADSLESACSGRPDREALGRAAFTIFAELIDNVFQHSSTLLDGYAALQVYSNGGKAQVVVSDSGIGILETLRPALQSDRLLKLSDTDLIVEIFREGISRHGSLRGCGLKESASKAIKYKAELDVHLPTCSVRLVPSSNGYRPNTAYCQAGLPLIWGTHICFYFALDKS